MSSTQLTAAQTAQLWEQAGGSPATAAMAVAIATAESGRRTDATHTNTDGSIDRGAWQINSVHGAQSTTDPLANAKAAVAISHNGLDWSAWTTYTSGAYKRYLQPGSSSPAAATPAPSSASPSSSSALFGSDKVSGLKYATTWTAIVGAGVILLLVGLNRAAGGAPARIARKTAGKAATAAVVA